MAVIKGLALNTRLSIILQMRMCDVATTNANLSQHLGGRQNIERQNTIFFSTFFFQVNSILSNKKSFSTFCLSIFCHTAQHLFNFKNRNFY
ncbi:hypothetical protein BpHYR1_022347 [Brachionus plicatilis]|uniref:Uncharacterized protein n=1 Tax=Brachionus plicatilis TaxID=10195 RepID=A0A3M7T2W8_BRAPC|nr:hypothetical protein BpHYR1_022347 [Brachionus plicatilis]